MGALGISVGGCGRIREVRTIWNLCGKMLELSTYGISVGGCKRIRELRTIWNLCGRIWELSTIWDLCGRVGEDTGAQDDMEPLWENVRGQDDMEALWGDMGGCGRSKRHGTCVEGYGRIWELRTIWYLCGGIGDHRSRPRDLP